MTEQRVGGDALVLGCTHSPRLGDAVPCATFDYDLFSLEADGQQAGTRHDLLPGAERGDGRAWPRPTARAPNGRPTAADTPEVTNEMVKTMLEVNRRPVIVRMWDVEPEEVGFLKRQDIPVGKRTVLEGEPRPGKTSRAVNIAAAIARGWPLLGEGSEAASQVEGRGLATAFVLRIADFDACQPFLP